MYAPHYRTLLCYSHSHHNHPSLHSFPTRRSSDLNGNGSANANGTGNGHHRRHHNGNGSANDYNDGNGMGNGIDRKSTRLNSSHPSISYAVFCLKKKKKHRTYSTVKKHPRTR